MGRRSTRDWETLVGQALRLAGDVFALEESLLAEEEAVQQLARCRYSTRFVGVGLALRDHLAAAARVIAEDCGDPAFGQFCTRYAAGVPIAQVAQELGRSRCHLSREWRPRAVRAITAQLRLQLHGTPAEVLRRDAPRKVLA